MVEKAEKKKELKEIEMVEIPIKIETKFKLPSGDIADRDEYLTWLGNVVWNIYKAVA